MMAAKPSSSAARNSSPFCRAPQPRSNAVTTSCVARRRRSGTGVPWSKRIFTSAVSGVDEAALGVLQYGLDLVARHARKPRQKIIHGGSALQILEKRLHRDTRALEKPDPADFPRKPLHGGTLRPVEHSWKMPVGVCKRKRCFNSIARR